MTQYTYSYDILSDLDYGINEVYIIAYVDDDNYETSNIKEITKLPSSALVNTYGFTYTQNWTEDINNVYLKVYVQDENYETSNTKIIYVSPVSATILFQGINSMSNIMYYDRILTDDEINIISNKGIVTKDLISFLPTVEGEGTTTYDVIAQEDVTHNGLWETGVATTPTYDFTVKTYVEK